jgi:hypothetical protein
MNFNELIKPKRSIGALRKAKKTKPKSPDLTGQLKLQRHTASAIVKQFDDDHLTEVVCNIAGWRNHDHVGAYLTAELSPRFAPPAPNEQRDIIDSIVNDQEEDDVDTI